MTKLSVVVSSANLRSEPSARHGNSTVLEAMALGTTCVLKRPASGHPDWVEVDRGKRSGFVKRMLCKQEDFGALVTPDAAQVTAFNNSLWDSTDRYNDVRYLLGGKNPETGRVDCSGWIAFINRLAFSEVNRVAGRKVFSNAVLGLFNTHSDHQVAIPGYRIGQLISGTDIDGLALRPGLLIGINNGDYDWEKNQGRVFEIDHIVQVMRSPSGTLYITQSSSSGGGVNKVKLEGWLEGTRAKRSDWRLHAIDLFALPGTGAESGIEDAEAGPLELNELDTSQTPAG